MKYSVLIALVVMLAGCNKHNEFADIEASELRKRAYRCVIATDLTAPEIQVCKNIRRECDRRQAEGNFDC